MDFAMKVVFEYNYESKRNDVKTTMQNELQACILFFSPIGHKEKFYLKER